MSSQSRVLIVDDSELNAMMVAAILEAFNIEADIAPGGEEAVKMVREKEYAFILMDNLMPGLSGVETTEKIKAFSSIPVYGMTADLTEDIAEEYRRAGASGTLSKPLKRNELEKVVEVYFPQNVPAEASDGTEQDMSQTSDSENTAEDSSKAAADSESKNGPSLRECLSGIEGFNYDTGLASAMGSEKSFFRMLKVTPSNIRNYIDILKEYIVEKDTPKLKLAAHSLKSIFAGLGIEELQAAAAELEKTANRFARGEGETLSEEDVAGIWHFINRTADVIAQTEQAVKRYQESLDALKDHAKEAEVVSLTAQQRVDVVTALNRALERFEIDGIMSGLSILKKASEGEERKMLEEAEEAAGMFDYDKVTSLLREIKML